MKLHISYKREGGGFQCDAVCDGGYTYLFYFCHGPPPNVGEQYKHLNLSPTARRVMWLASWLPNRWTQIYMDNLFNLQKLFTALHIAEALAHGVACTNGCGVPLLDYLAYSGEYTGAFSFSSENLNNCEFAEFLQARSLQNVAHNLATTFLHKHHTCHCLAVVAKSFRNRFIRNQHKHFTMGIRHDIEQGLNKYEITVIDGQPMDEDLNLLTTELTNAAGSVATQNGGGEHGHVGMVIDQAEYITFSSSGARFVIPTNPGPYPARGDTNKVIHERQIAEHKAECIEYETYLGVENYLRRMIVKSINHRSLAEVESETMGFNHLSPKALLTHLRNVGGSLDHMDVTELFTNIQKPWDGIEAPAAHFARGNKYERQLLKVGQNKNPEL